MKKQSKTLIIFAGVLAVLVAALAISSQLPGNEPEETTMTTRPAIDPVFEAELSDVSRIDIVNPDDQFSLVPDEVTDDNGSKRIWQIEGMEDFPFSSRAIEQIANVALVVYTSTEIETNAQDLDQYGLENPETTFTVTLNNGDRHVIKFGRELVSGNFDYVMLDDTGRVCTVASATGNRIRQTRLDLVDDGMVLNIDLEELSMFTFERARDDVKIVTECTLMGELGSGTEYFDFNVLEPIRRPGSPEGLMRLLEEALNISVSRFVEINPEDLSQYGLDQPQYVFQLEAGADQALISLGAKADGNHFYAISSQIPAVFTVRADAFATIDMRVTDMLDRFVQLISIWSVDRIEADILGTEFVVDITMDQDQRATDEEVEFELNGEDAKIFNERNRSLFTPFYQSIIGVMMAGLDVDAAPDLDAEARIVFHLKPDPGNDMPERQQVVEFTARDAYTYYVFIDGEYSGFYIDGNAAFHSKRADSEGILVALDMLKYAMEHAVDGVFNTQEGYQLD